MEIHFEIENKCLLRCRHCSSQASSDGKTMDYSVGDMAAFLRRMKGRKEVYLTGGEPLLYSGVETLLECLNTEAGDTVLGMFTTGIRGNGLQKEAVSEEYAKQLAGHGLKVCYLSVYDSRKEEHDWMTGFKGSFAMTENAVRNFKKAGMDVRFNSVVTAKNADKIPELIQMGKDWGISEIRLLKLISQGRAENCWNEIGITEERYRSIIRNILEREHPVKITASGAVDILPCRASGEKYVCPAGCQLWYVTYQGDVYPCASVKNRTDYRIGNVKEDIWENCEKFCGRSNGKILCGNIS